MGLLSTHYGYVHAHNSPSSGWLLLSMPVGGEILKLATINSLFVLLYSNTITLVCNVLVQVVTSFVFISVLSGFIPCLFQLLISLNSFDQFKQCFLEFFSISGETMA